MTQKAVLETTVTEGLGSSIPAAVRRRLGIQPGDKLLWEIEGSAVAIRVRKRRPGVFRDFDGYDFDTTEHHDEVF